MVMEEKRYSRLEEIDGFADFAIQGKNRKLRAQGIWQPPL
jgi:hypothetical protein